MIIFLSFTSRTPSRTAGSPLGSGVTDIRLMRPTSVGATTSYPVGTRFDKAIIQALQPYTTVRYTTSVTQNEEANWSDRTLPGYHTAVRGFASMAWEDEVTLSNESGRDLYIQIPMNATDDYIQKLANLIKYGSDGVNPYTSPQSKPVYAGLSSNLRVYVEWSNEIWNWAFTQGPEGVQLAKDAVKLEHAKRSDHQLRRQRPRRQLPEVVRTADRRGQQHLPERLGGCGDG